MHDLAPLTLEQAIARHSGEAGPVERDFRNLMATEKTVVDQFSEVVVGGDLLSALTQGRLFSQFDHAKSASYLTGKHASTLGSGEVRGLPNRIASNTSPN
jgi:hypothetical protein